MKDAGRSGRGHAARLVEHMCDRRNCGKLTIEVTETVLLDDLTTVAAQLDEVRRLGPQVAVDDFGTGYNRQGFFIARPMPPQGLQTWARERLQVPAELAGHYCEAGSDPEEAVQRRTKCLTGSPFDVA